METPTTTKVRDRTAERERSRLRKQAQRDAKRGKKGKEAEKSREKRERDWEDVEDVVVEAPAKKRVVEEAPKVVFEDLPSPWIPLAVGLGGLFLYNKSPMVQEWVQKSIQSRPGCSFRSCHGG